MKSPKGKGRKRSAAAARTAKPRAVDLLQAVRAHIEQQGIPRASDLPKRLSITRFATVTVSRERVKMEHFAVPGAVDAPELARTVIECPNEVRAMGKSTNAPGRHTNPQPVP